VIITEVFATKTSATPQQVIDVSKEGLRKYDKAAKEQDSSLGCGLHHARPKQQEIRLRRSVQM
jgi:hypothetical protein